VRFAPAASVHIHDHVHVTPARWARTLSLPALGLMREAAARVARRAPRRLCWSHMSDDSSQSEYELQHFGKYLLDQELARGGMSRVYRARLRGPGGFEKKLVVKQILPELARDPSFIELFVKEANTLVQMSHPNLVPVYELGVIDGVYFLAMEAVEGATVAELLESGPLAVEQVVQIGAQIAEALRYAHERFEIVHRDVTPRNVIIDQAGHARLLDFGIAAPIGHERHGELFGSPGYIAPEQLRGEALGPDSDLFALGAVLYEALSARPAFPAARAARADGSADIASYEPPAALSGVDREIDALVMQLVALERTARPQSAADIASRLRTWLAERHPRGVERELAERAHCVHMARESRPRGSQSDPLATSSGRIEVRSLAVSPALTAMLQEATQRIARVSPAAVQDEAGDGTAAAPDPEVQRLLRRFLRDALVISGALVVAIYLAEHAEREPYAPLPPAAQTASAPLPAAQPLAGGAAELPSEGAARSEPAAAAAETSPEAPRVGFVTVSAAPWAEVQLDGRSVGITPRRRMAVRPGKHTLELSCPPLGKHARVSLDLRSDEALQVVVDLNETPVKVSVR
jgi:eukaryotic-like serine/threonine-protein kinase